MKKTIIILGVALVAFTNLAGASTVSTASSASITVVEGNSPLCNAILKGDIESVKKFIEYGANINEMSNGLTPLMFAARYNKVEILKYLVEKGADKQIKDERGNTAMKYAENSKSVEAIEFLKQA
ncbi:MAG: ankyrin repeat domain-containing protein [Flavobacterium sp.]